MTLAVVETEMDFDRCEGRHRRQARRERPRQVRRSAAGVGRGGAPESRGVAGSSIQRSVPILVRPSSPTVPVPVTAADRSTAPPGGAHGA